MDLKYWYYTCINIICFRGLRIVNINRVTTSCNREKELNYKIKCKVFTLFLLHHKLQCSNDTGGWITTIQFPAKAGFFVHHLIQTNYGPPTHAASHQMGARSSFTRGKVARLWSYHLLLILRLKICGAITLIHYVFMNWLKHRDKWTSPFAISYFRMMNVSTFHIEHKYLPL
jgi:hypothetical protein